MDSFGNQLEPTPVMSTSCGMQPRRPPGENDVIVGAGCNKHSGNLKFQQFIKAYKRARFQTNPKIETAEAVKEVVEFWRRLSPRGRFLQIKGSDDGEWHEVDDKQAMRIASFFLMNQKSGDLKRQKSIDAIRSSRTSLSGPPLVRSQSGPVPQARPRGSSCGQDILLGSGMGGQDKSAAQAIGQMSNQFNDQIPDFMASLEPMPIGPTNTKSMGCDRGQIQQRQQQQQQQHSHQKAHRMSLQEPDKSTSEDLDQSLDPLDFNPIPFKPNREPVDDFEPIQTNFNTNFASSKKNVDLSTNAQFGGATDQVQVSVNMVVNTMPQGFQRENAVNTVTNIQIGTGTISDERKQPSKPCHNGNGVPGQNFQLTTDTSNGFIQISAQSNQSRTDDRSIMNLGSAQRQMNDFQVGFFGNQDEGGNKLGGQGNGLGFNSVNGFNGSGGVMGNNGMQMINRNMTNNGSMMNGNRNMAINTLNVNMAGTMMNGNMAGSMTNGNMSANGNIGGNGNMPCNMNMIHANVTGNENMMGNMMINNTGQDMNASTENAASNNSNGSGQNNALRWNKNEVANSVPCAASLVGSLFDDF